VPCYGGRDEIKQKYQTKKAARVEAVLCAVVRAYGLDGCWAISTSLSAESARGGSMAGGKAFYRREDRKQS
jgi:hypothetical protein